MRILTGDECGLLKEFVPEIAHRKQAAAESNNANKSDIILPTHHDNMQKINSHHGMQRVDPNEPQTRARGVVALTLLNRNEAADAFSFASLRSNGSVEVWRGTRPAITTKNKFAQYQRTSCLSKDIFATAKESSAIVEQVPVKPLAMECLQPNHANESPRLVACDTHGNVVILKSTPLSEEPPSILHQFEAFDNTPDNITLTYTKGKVVNRQLASAMALQHTGHAVAIGGRERDVRLLDLETGKATWKAKNLPPDPQTLLQQPIWPSSMAFWDNDGNPHTLAVGTAFGQVRLYDVRMPPHTSSILRRPVRYTPIDDNTGVHQHRITAVCPVSEHHIVAGDTTGDLHALDKRYNFNGQRGNKQVDGTASTGRYVGPSGSIRQVVKHATLPIIAVVGCDRMLRTYNTNTNKNIDCVYLKQRLNCVLMCPEGMIDSNNDDDGGIATANAGDAGADMDQEDVVRDYVDSDEDDSSSDDDDGGGRGEHDDDDASSSSSSNDDVDERNGTNGGDNKQQQGDDDDSSADSDDDDKSESGSGGSASHDNDSESSEAESSQDEAPRKRRRR